MDINLKQKLIEDGFFIIPKFITVEQAQNLFSLYKNCELLNGSDDIYVPNSSHAVTNFGPFLELLCIKNIEVANLVSEMVLPTYSYARIYKHGNILERHLDRPACEISLSVHLQGDKEWPIYMEKPTGEIVGVVLRPGDAVLYLGCDTPHWRDAYDGEEYGQVFLHYVLSNGIHSDQYFNISHIVQKNTQHLISEKLKMESQ
jgi:hypothetical protein